MHYSLLGMDIADTNVRNIGDYVQALAAEQFLPQVDGFIQRERLDEYTGRTSTMIMNGWFMHDGKHWPPSSEINPLWVAFHLNSDVEKELLSPTSISYFKKHEPIGCRDIRTANLLKEKGVDSYFSGCLTLTLGRKYRSLTPKRETIYFVDPAIAYNPSVRLQGLLQWLANPLTMLKLASRWHIKINGPLRSRIRKLLEIGVFFKNYSTVFHKSVLLNAEYITQQSEEIKMNYPTDSDRLKYAEQLIKKYAEADFVVTSRIHCALPCLGLETPVIYVEQDPSDQPYSSSCRLEGLRELFNTITIEHRGSLKYPFECKTPIRSHLDVPANKNSWRPLADALINKCTSFISQADKKL